MTGPTDVIRRVLAGLACGLLVAAAACSSDDDAASGGTTPGETGSGDAPEQAGPPFAVGRRSLTLVDTSRGTDEVPGVSPASPERTLPVDLVYPAAGEPGPDPTPVRGAPATATEDAPPAGGEFPLVVFAHGWDGLGANFVGFAESWAREGYVVALPTFPLSRDGIAESADVRNQPGDISLVIDSLTGLDSPLAEHVDLDRVAVGGHSLGGATVLGIAYNSCCLDERVDAVVEVAGGPLPFEGGTYATTSSTPMLLVHGTADATVPVNVGDAAVFDLFDAPIWYLRLDGATHTGVFEGDAGALLDRAVVGFLDAQLRDEPETLDAVGAEVTASGIAEWRVRPGPG